MSLEFRLEAFEGPLDLLLLLIEKNKVDIYDIPIAVITDQYLEYVNEMQEDNLEVLSDFLVMASTLLEIKARMLLPKETDGNGEEQDPRTELVERLIEYQECKMRADLLQEQYENAEEHFFRLRDIPDEVKNYEPAPDLDLLLRNVTPERLQAVFESVLRRMEDTVDPVRSRFGNIRQDPVRISDKLAHVLEYGKSRKHFSFRELLMAQHTKTDAIVTFLACLELIKVGQIFVTQEDTFADIMMEWNDDCENVLTKEDIRQYD